MVLAPRRSAARAGRPPGRRRRPPGDDPHAGLPTYAALVESAMGGRDDVVLVGQAAGAFTVAAVAALTGVGHRAAQRDDPGAGETPGQWWEAVGQERLASPQPAGGGWPSEFDLDTYFLHDVDPAVAASGESHQRPRERRLSAPSASSPPGRRPRPRRVRRRRPVLPARVPAPGRPRPARHRAGRRLRALAALSHPTEVAAYLLGVVPKSWRSRR